MRKPSIRTRIAAAALALGAALPGGAGAATIAAPTIGVSTVAAVGVVTTAAVAANVVTAEPADAYTQTPRNRWLIFGPAQQGQCWLGYDRNYSAWEEWTGQGTDGWYPSYRIGDWNCGRYTS